MDFTGWPLGLYHSEHALVDMDGYRYRDWDVDRIAGAQGRLRFIRMPMVAVVTPLPSAHRGVE